MIKDSNNASLDSGRSLFGSTIHREERKKKATHGSSHDRTFTCFALLPMDFRASETICSLLSPVKLGAKKDVAVVHCLN